MAGPEDKGKRYVNLLETARVEGAWSEFPELIRKVNKHAGKRTALIQTASAEHYVATQASSRPTTSAGRPTNPLEPLQQTLKSTDNPIAEEAFQGRTCLSWAKWTGVAEGSAESIPTSDVVPLFDKYGQKGTSTWTKICLVKAVFFQARSHAQRKEEEQAYYALKAAAAWTEFNSGLVKSVPQLSYWAEQTLSSFILSKSESMSSPEKLNILRIWLTLAAKSQEVSPSIYGNVKSHTSRSSIWQIYYRIISDELARPQQISSVPRSVQASELRTVESAYETNFLRNRKFPKATESNAPVEEWVEQVIHNWQILCGPGWHESDLGEGGRNATTRNVLDVLYRAATKTFHSTLILRRLFQVHKALTEFDLAYSCLDTYIELTDRSRTRSAKSGDVDPNQDSDEVILLVFAEGIEGLSAYGGQKEARKAFELAMKLEDWLEQMVPDSSEVSLPNGHSINAESDSDKPNTPTNEALQIVCRAIGIAKAQWARWTPVSESRTALQAEALTALQKACSLSQPELSTRYALALLCAETRDIPEAISHTKAALTEIAQMGSSVAGREQCAFWHLMTLLLTAQQDFETALQSSAATLDDVLGLGPESRTSSTNGSVERHKEYSGPYAADDLECDDLQRVVELQISYLALVELINGSEPALNHSNELLSLYPTLFKRFEVGSIKPQPENSLVPPKSSAGTIKSTKGSLFSRRKHLTASAAPSATTLDTKEHFPTSPLTRPTTQASQAPTIQVTDETGKSPAKKHGHHLVHRSHNNESASKTLGRKSSEVGRTNTANVSQAVTSDFEANTQIDTSLRESIVPTSSQHDSRQAAKQPLSEVPHNVHLHDKIPPPTGHSTQPPEQDVRLPTVHPKSTRTSPVPRSPKVPAQKHALIVLSKTWLTVATLYRRSHMFEDAREACEEAAKVAAKIEALVSATDPSARVLAETGWGAGSKSSDEVWADVCCTKAELLHSIANRREGDGQLMTSEAIREIVEQYEQCLMYFPDHRNGIIGLSNILLDYYEKKVDLTKRVDEGRSYSKRTSRNSSVIDDDVLGALTPSQEHLHPPFNVSIPVGGDHRKTPENLNRIAARDRAYGLLSTLTKLGTGWDSSEAWFALARAHELGGEVDKAKNILWWCIELEDSKPIRHWRNLGCSGYVL